jgi:hypothetical protein
MPVGEQIPEEEGCMVSNIFIPCYKYNLCELLYGYGAYVRYRTTIPEWEWETQRYTET